VGLVGGGAVLGCCTHRSRACRRAGESAVRGLALTDAVENFADEAQRHLAKAAALVNDVRVRTAADDDGVDASTSAPEQSAWARIRGHAVGLARALAPNLGGTPPSEPITYLNALSAGAVLSQPTESELQRQREGDVASWSRWLASAWEVAKLRAALTWIDLVMWWFAGGADGAAPAAGEASADGSSAEAAASTRRRHSHHHGKDSG
jgi:hypothetical protein